VSQGSMSSIRGRAARISTAPSSAATAPMPSISRTEARSLVSRDIRSPVFMRWKYESGSRCRWAKSWFRRSHSMWREKPKTLVRQKYRNTP